MVSQFPGLGLYSASRTKGLRLWSELFLVSQDTDSQVGDTHIHLPVRVKLGSLSGNINSVEFSFEWSCVIWVLYTVSDSLVQNLWRTSSNAHG